tara:strand:- start:179 stop:1075 length:897 start_codon:yes stop_codon:yes gene_type:complete
MNLKDLVKKLIYILDIKSKSEPKSLKFVDVKNLLKELNKLGNPIIGKRQNARLENHEQNQSVHSSITSKDALVSYESKQSTRQESCESKNRKLKVENDYIEDSQALNVNKILTALGDKTVDDKTYGKNKLDITSQNYVYTESSEKTRSTNFSHNLSTHTSLRNDVRYENYENKDNYHETAHTEKDAISDFTVEKNRILVDNAYGDRMSILHTGGDSTLHSDHKGMRTRSYLVDGKLFVEQEVEMMDANKRKFKTRMFIENTGKEKDEYLKRIDDHVSDIKERQHKIKDYVDKKLKENQ